MMKLPLDGSPSARSMTLCDHRSTSLHSALSSLAEIQRHGQPHRQGRIADRLDERPCFRCQLRRLAHPALIQRDPSPARPWRWPATPCPRRRCTTHVIHQSGHRPHVHRLARRSRTTWCAGQCAWPPGWGPRRVMRRRSFGRAPNCVVLRRCRGWSPTWRRACASRRRRAHHRRPPDVRRSAQHFRQPRPGHGIRSRRPAADAARHDPISAAIRRPRCGSADGGTHTRDRRVKVI